MRTAFHISRRALALLLALAVLALAGCSALPVADAPTTTPAIDVRATQEALAATQSALEARSTEQAGVQATATAEAETTAQADFDATATASAYTLSALVVSDGILPGTNRFSSGEVIRNTLEDLGYRVDYLSTLDDGIPPDRYLDQYDVVFWSIGEDCCNSPHEFIQEILMEYLDNKGQLVIDGSTIGLGSMNTPFLQDYLGANWKDIGNMVDVTVADPDHPLNKDLPPHMRLTEAPFPPDAITPLDDVDAEAFWLRGPSSAQSGQAAAVAYANDDRRVIYVAFPLKFLQRQELRIFLSNAMEWFEPRDLGEPTA